MVEAFDEQYAAGVNYCSIFLAGWGEQKGMRFSGHYRIV